MARRLLIAACLTSAALLSSGCGSRASRFPRTIRTARAPSCSPSAVARCHTLKAAGTQGSTTNVADRENVDGPNFDTRVESAEDVEYAIENGGFSGAIMPENIATGAREAADRRVPRQVRRQRRGALAAARSRRRRAGPQADPSRARGGSRGARAPRPASSPSASTASSSSTRRGARRRRPPRRCAPSRRRPPRRSRPASATARRVRAARPSEDAVGQGQGARRAGAP